MFREPSKWPKQASNVTLFLFADLLAKSFNNGCRLVVTPRRRTSP